MWKVSPPRSFYGQLPGIRCKCSALLEGIAGVPGLTRHPLRCCPRTASASRLPWKPVCTCSINPDLMWLAPAISLSFRHGNTWTLGSADSPRTRNSWISRLCRCCAGEVLSRNSPLSQKEDLANGLNLNLRTPCTGYLARFYESGLLSPSGKDHHYSQQYQAIESYLVAKLLTCPPSGRKGRIFFVFAAVSQKSPSK